MTTEDLLPEGVQDTNINISAYRVLYILRLLVQYRGLSSVELNDFLYDNPLIQRVYNTETLTKYINTLREVGCKIPRSSSRNDYNYELLQNPFPLDLGEAERNVLARLTELLDASPDEALADDFRLLLSKLSWSLTEPLELPSPPDEPEPHPYLNLPEIPVACAKSLAKRYQRYCREGFMLALTVRDAAGEIQELHLEPYDVVEQGDHQLLVGLDAKTHAQHAIQLDRILSVHSMPAKNKGQARQTTVVFAVYGRLSKTYRPYPGEKIVFSNAERLHVKTRVLETSGLINRLMKYGDACRIISPEPVRQAVKQRLQSLLDTFET